MKRPGVLKIYDKQENWQEAINKEVEDMNKE
jgi:hypothetical protein